MSRGKYLPPSFQKEFENALFNRQLFSMDEDLAVLEALLAPKLEALANTASPAMWMEAKQLYQVALKGGTSGAQALIELGVILNKAADSIAAEGAISQILEQRRKIIDTEARKLQVEAQNLNASQAAMMTKALIAAVNAEVQDSHVRARIGQHFATLLLSVGIRVADSGEPSTGTSLEAAS